MKEQGYKQQYFKDVECFDCRHKFKVGRSAKSTQCPACGVHLCLEDFDINVSSTQPIRTRGDVLIRKNGNVNTSEIRCRDLKIFGLVSAQIECTGDLVFRTSGTVIGEVRCRRFTVEKGSDIHFHNMIYADEVDVQARVFGNIQCSGKINIGAQGWIHGDVTARAVSIEPGGQLDGAMNILRSTPQKPAAPPVKPQEKSSPGARDDIGEVS
jgi:cytoskeletal protein CcmA (bactofilin family)